MPSILPITLLPKKQKRKEGGRPEDSEDKESIAVSAVGGMVDLHDHSRDGPGPASVLSFVDSVAGSEAPAIVAGSEAPVIDFDAFTVSDASVIDPYISDGARCHERDLRDIVNSLLTLPPSASPVRPSSDGTTGVLGGA